MNIRHPAALPVLWRRWTEVIAGFAEREPGHLRLDAIEYEALHRALLAVCATLAAHGEPEGAAWLGSLQDLVQPWLTVHSLEQADRELLADVLAHCRAIDREMGGRAWRGSLRRQRRLVIVVAACLLIPPLVVAVAYWGGLPLGEFFETTWRTLRRMMRGTGDLGFWFATSGMLALCFVLWTIWATSGPKR